MKDYKLRVKYSESEDDAFLNKRNEIVMKFAFHIIYEKNKVYRFDVGISINEKRETKIIKIEENDLLNIASILSINDEEKLIKIKIKNLIKNKLENDHNYNIIKNKLVDKIENFKNDNDFIYSKDREDTIVQETEGSDEVRSITKIRKGKITICNIFEKVKISSEYEKTYYITIRNNDCLENIFKNIINSPKIRIKYLLSSK